MGEVILEVCPFINGRSYMANFEFRINLRGIPRVGDDVSPWDNGESIGQVLFVKWSGEDAPRVRIEPHWKISEAYQWVDDLTKGCVISRTYGCGLTLKIRELE